MKTAPGAGDWVLLSDAGHVKELWTSHTPRPHLIHDQMLQIKSVDILSVLPCSQDRQPAVLLLFLHHAWLSNWVVAAGQADKQPWHHLITSSQTPF